MNCRCLACGAEYQIPGHIVGRRFRCKSCGNVIDTGDKACLFTDPAPSMPAPGANAPTLPKAAPAPQPPASPANKPNAAPPPPLPVFHTRGGTSRLTRTQIARGPSADARTPSFMAPPPPSAPPAPEPAAEETLAPESVEYEEETPELDVAGPAMTSADEAMAAVTPESADEPVQSEASTLEADDNDEEPARTIVTDSGEYEVVDVDDLVVDSGPADEEAEAGATPESTAEAEEEAYAPVGPSDDEPELVPEDAYLPDDEPEPYAEPAAAPASPADATEPEPAPALPEADLEPESAPLQTQAETEASGEQPEPAPAAVESEAAPEPEIPSEPESPPEPQSQPEPQTPASTSSRRVVDANGVERSIVPETHELIRQEDVEETLMHLSDETNTALPQFTQAHIDWIRLALAERRDLCARQYRPDGRVDEQVNRRLKELDQQINGVSPEILRVLHFLSRIRAIIPALLALQEEVKVVDPDPTRQMIKQMKYECSKAEVQSAIRGLADLHIRPRILEELARGNTPKG